MRPLVEAGHVYIAVPPLYRIYNGNESYYAYEEAMLKRLRRNRLDQLQTATL